ncbi:MAG: hypothetical protein RSE58_12625 [Clostridia bacterium]
MITRFLRYALAHERKIRAVFMLAGVPVQKTISVLAFDETSVTLLIGAKKQPTILPMTDLLSCDYARGDHGED